MKLLARTGAWLVSAAVAIVALFAFASGAYAAAALHPFAGVAFFMAGWIPVVLIHELGHAIAARLVGWRVAIFHVAPFTIRARPFALRFDGRLGGPDIAGLVLSLPRNPKHDTWRRSAWISAGGPIASWVLAAGCLYLAVGVDLYRLGDGAAVVLTGEHLAPEASIQWERGPPLGGRENALRTLAFAFAAYSLLLAAATSWPASLRNGWRNDARKLASLLATRPVAPVRRSAPEVARVLSSYDVPTRSIEPWLVDALEKEAPRQMLFADFLQALRKHDETALRGAAEALGAAHPETPEALVAQGFVAVWLDGDPARADFFLSSAHNLADNDVMSVRACALAMILRLEGNIEGAERALDAIPHMRPPWRALAQRVLRAPLKARTA